jgi:putative FmdB family regulatory protein
MPKYKYRCADCEQEFVAFHPIKEKLRDCTVCGIVDSLVRLPGVFVSDTTLPKESRAGALVEEKIKQFREELEKQKQACKEEIHE